MKLGLQSNVCKWIKFQLFAKSWYVFKQINQNQHFLTVFSLYTYFLDRTKNFSAPLRNVDIYIWSVILFVEIEVYMYMCELLFSLYPSHTSVQTLTYASSQTSQQNYFFYTVLRLDAFPATTNT